jgi:hypothetical protein
MISSTAAAEAPLIRPKRPIKIRPATFTDYDAIAAVEQRNGLVTRARDEWVALWSENPAYKNRAEHWDIGWVMEAPTGDIVGTFSSVPLAYRFRGRDLRAAIGVGWAVDLPYRAYSIWLLQYFLKHRNVDLFLSTTTSPEAEPVLRLLKWVPAPVGQWGKSAFWITGHRGFLAAALHKKNLQLPAWIVAPVAGMWSCTDRIGRARLCRKGSGAEIEVECRTSFDQGFEQLWRQFESENRNTLLAARDRDTLEWHFRSSLLANNLWILAATRNGRLLGYALLDREDKPDSGLRRARLIDFFAVEAEQEVLRTLLCWVLERCKKQNIHVLEVFGCWLDRPDMARIQWPYRRKLPSGLYYYFVPDPQLREELAAPSVWRPSSFDGDASLGTWGQPHGGA